MAKRGSSLSISKADNAAPRTSNSMPLPYGRFKRCKVTLARVTAKTVWAFVEVELDSGACGVGEITLSQREARLIDAAEHLFQTWDGQGSPTSYAPRLALADAAVRGGLCDGDRGSNKLTIPSQNARRSTNHIRLGRRVRLGRDRDSGSTRANSSRRRNQASVCGHDPPAAPTQD